ncbi:MAG: DUF5677 domain-containing protein [Candidatus Thiodiazotropha taylori]|uniref:DUF5677 domain-containing protein n=1 Tax=Candidatus Thiodiazotropha taylori TaxID=2792791 RepID=A0A9E4KAA5_9GAMM|nr:DUF5677 domain-containing protein [Candidatus Thiodiazotropha taylori]MCG7945335.1 DUF5677 domain-containing protein [Candidatus Thiodiazotropha taylori]MCW4255449.1 DUF5677 domain-containing protein [Candidatus Thiodiazotropha taylori]MCW4255459.1 DUF5677 domain-containing protein [Candidatus Thiodiazotropha taylori]
MSDYKEIYNDFQVILEDCKRLSIENAGVSSPTSAHYYASLIFTKLCTSGVTTLSICPSPSKVGKNAHWDCASVASLTRGIIETYLVFFYLCVEESDPKEWEARRRLLNLHDHMSRLKMFRVMEGADNQVAQFERYTDEVKSDLEKTDYFKSLTSKQKMHYLKGNNAFFKSQDELIESSGGNVDDFRFMYRFLSNHTHSYPMGFYRMAESGRGTGVESEVEIEYTGMCLSWAGLYLTKAKSGFFDLWANHRE